MTYEIIPESNTTPNILNQNNFDPNLTPIQESSDLSQTIRELNDDSEVDKFSNIDMKTNLTADEISAILQLDALIVIGYIPKEFGYITRAKKRISPSLMGRGRQDIVDIAAGQRDNNQGRSFFDRFSGMFKGE